MSRVVRRCCATAAVVVLVAACSGDDSGSSSSSSTAASLQPTTPVQQTRTNATSPPATAVSATTAPASGCRVKVTGDVETEFTGNDDVNAFSSDHYLSDEEVDSILALTTAVTEPTVPGEESDLTLAPGASGNAIVSAWFLLNCRSDDTTFGVYSDAMSTRDDIPFAIGTYDVAAPGAADDPEALRAFIVFGSDPTPGVWTVDDGSELTISRFDTRGAQGSFRVPMTEQFPTTGTSGRHVVVEGSFDVTCKTGARCTA